MPKLSKKIVKRVAEAEATHGFKLIPPGKYFARLAGVEAKQTKDDNPMWVAEFKDIFSIDGEKQPGRQWWNLNLPLDPDDVPAGKDAQKWATAQSLSEGRLKAFFEGFGYSEDSDTDEMINEVAVITIGIRKITQGNRTGEDVNQINDIEPTDDYEDELEAIDWEAAVGGGASDPDDTY